MIATFAGGEKLLLKIDKLKIGQEIRYTGEFLVMRDQSQKRLQKIVENEKNLPFDLSGKIIFYAGPAKIPHKKRIGAIGPTTSERMDIFLKTLFELGVIATVGKGKRSKKAIELHREWKRVYFIAPSGVSAFLSTCVMDMEVIAFEDLGPEAVYRLKVKDFPLIVAIDIFGNCLFE